MSVYKIGPSNPDNLVFKLAKFDSDLCIGYLVIPS